MDYLATNITRVDQLGADYAMLFFECPKPISGLPGQFAMVRGDWGTDPILPRAFSLVEIGEEGAILVRAVGKGTRRLVAMRPGDPLEVMGPAGKGFSLELNGRLPILVAGGVGVAPIVFLGEFFASRGISCRSFYGARTRADLPLRERLEKIGELTITTEDGSVGRGGLVTQPLQEFLQSGASSSFFVFSCGPHGMLQAVARVCEEVGVPCEVALESPMACGMGTCKGCAVEVGGGAYKYVCCDGPVFDAQEIFGGTK